jgi:hypothetical protein
LFAQEQVPAATCARDLTPTPGKRDHVMQQARIVEDHEGPQHDIAFVRDGREAVV